jgi:hypothetical protein
MNRQVFRLVRGGGPKSGVLPVSAGEQIHLRAPVGALCLLERILVVGWSDGAMAAQAYGIAGAVVVGDVLEGEPGGVPEGGERLGGHELASFSAAERSATLFRVYALGAGKSLGIGLWESSGGAIGHPRVEIHEGADVHAFLMREPWLLPGGSYGSVAAEAYGVTGSIFVVPVLEVEAVGGWVKPRVGHKVACFRATDFDAINKSTLYLTIQL